MTIVVIGGSGFLGAKLVGALRDRGREVLAASPRSGVNSLTGEGLADAIAGAEVVVDVYHALGPVRWSPTPAGSGHWPHG